MNCAEYEVKYPDTSRECDQHEEWITLVTDDGTEKVKLHDYDRFFEVPGLYEEVLYDHLKCTSPEVVCTHLDNAMNGDPIKVRALDFGAGNGMVGERLKEGFDCETLVGLDIIPEARDAAERDRPGVYNQYYVMDLSRPDREKSRELEKWNFNTLITVAALGYGDIPTKAFVNAFNIIEPGGWVAFNIKDRFLSHDDDTGYRDTIDLMMGESLDVLANTRYRHRYSLAGEPLYYHAIVGRKIKDVQSH